MATRRYFLRTAAFLGAAASLSAADVSSVLSNPAKLKVRRNIYSLDPAGPEIATLRAGIQAMKALNPASGVPTNPKSWLYQRGIHRVPLPAPSPLPVAWNTCTHHGSPGPAFLSWHRAYLYYFERICRSVSGDANFTLPYWNYDHTGQDTLPGVFLNSAASNTLYYTPRGANDGLPIAVEMRGEQGTISVTAFNDFQDALQDCHDNTHGAIGGSMGSVPTAALDPIFYLHHANIDRCWRHWQLQHLGNADPSPVPSWWGTSWTFFDETGAQVHITGQQAEHTPNLGYVYDDEPRNPVGPAVIDLRPKLVNICQRFPFLCQRMKLLQQQPWPLPLPGTKPLPLPIKLPREALQTLSQLKRESAPGASRGLLALELVLDWNEGSPPIVAEARPAGSKDDTGWIVVGAVSSFARGGRRDTVQIDVSRVLDRLGQSAADLEWRVRFTSGRRTHEGREKALSNAATVRAQVWGAQFTLPGMQKR